MAEPKRELCGVLPVFQTPFHPDETIDFDTLEREFAWRHDCGAQGIVMAMVSETLRLASEEREQLAGYSIARSKRPSKPLGQTEAPGTALGCVVLEVVPQCPARAWLGKRRGAGAHRTSTASSA